MNGICIICADLFTPLAEIFTTVCGHLFHQDCLKQWIERSKTCPQCRHKETLSSIHRIYLNFASADGIADDVITLKSKLDTVNFEISVKDKEIAKYSHKYKACKEKCTRMREAIVEMEQEQRTHESSMLALEYQIKAYRERVKDKDELVANIDRLKKQIEGMDHLKTVISNYETQVNQMLNLNNDPESLSILMVTLKRQQEENRKKNRDISSQIYRIGKEMLNTNSTMEKVRTRTGQIEQDLVAHENCASEVSYLSDKIKDATNQAWMSGNSTITSAAASASNSMQENDSIIILDSSTTASTSRSSHSYYTPVLPSTSSGHGHATRSSAVTNLRAHFESISSPKDAPVIVNLADSEPSSSSSSSSTSTRSSQEKQRAKSAKNETVAASTSGHGLKRTKSSSSYTSATKFRKLAPRNLRRPS